MSDKGFTNWKLELVNKRTGLIIDDDAGKARVMTAGAPASPTLYADSLGTALTNPITFTNGKAEFWTVNTITSVDVSIMTAAGEAVYLRGTTPGLTKVEVDKEQMEHVLVIPFGPNDNDVLDTGFDIPANMLITDVSMRVDTVDATETIEFGFENAVEGGDLDGLIDAALVDTAGYVELEPQITGGTNIDYVGTNYVGALLCTSIAGADAVATVGGFTRKKYRTDGTIKSFVYTGSAGSDTAAGYFFVRYQKAV